MHSSMSQSKLKRLWNIKQPELDFSPKHLKTVVYDLKEVLLLSLAGWATTYKLAHWFDGIGGGDDDAE